MSDRILVLSFAFPPLAAPEAVLSAKAVIGLHRGGAKIEVVAAAPAAWRRKDPSLVDAVERTATVHRVVEPMWLPFVQPAPATRRFPDAMHFLRRRARRMALALDLDQYDGLITWSQWHSIHLVGLDLKRRRRDLPWLAHFSDPWVGNPLVGSGRFSTSVGIRMERAVAEGADILDFTTQDQAALMLGHHRHVDPAKVLVLPHVFDETLFPPAAPRNGSTVLRYVGSFYANRTPEPLLRGLARIAARRPEILRDVRVELVGDLPRTFARSITRRSLPAELVHLIPSVPYRTSLALMRTADALLLIDAPAARSVFLPSKLVDYVGAGRPIVAITPPGEARDLVSRVGGWTADPADDVAIADALTLAIESARAIDAPCGDHGPRADLDAEVVGRARLTALREARPG